MAAKGGSRYCRYPKKRKSQINSSFSDTPRHPHCHQRLAGSGERKINFIKYDVIVNLIDRLLIDKYWVGHTKAWEIPGTDDMKPYINTKDKIGKWLMETVGFAILCAMLSGIMALMLR